MVKGTLVINFQLPLSNMSPCISLSHSNRVTQNILGIRDLMKILKFTLMLKKLGKEGQESLNLISSQNLTAA